MGTFDGHPLEFILQGDVEAAAIDIIQSSTHVTAFTPVSITTNLNGYVAGNTWIVITRQGGSYKWTKPSYPRVDFEVFASSRSVAHDLAQVCLAVMFQQQNNYTGFGVRYIACEVETDLFEAQEKDTNQYKYIFSLRLVVKPA